MELSVTTKVGKKSGYNGTPPGMGTLLRSVYKFPPGFSLEQRLVIRTRQLHDLSKELEASIRGDSPREHLCIYSWAVDYIALELKVIADRLEMRNNPDKGN